MSIEEDSKFVNIAVQGCCHGELDSIYNAILDTQQKTQQRVDLLIICGDMQCIRHTQDLQSLAVPPKYRQFNTFHQYVTGEKVAPIPTIFIGGNHEASNLLQSLYYGGYVAPNIYYMGFAGVIRFRGLRIAGISGIYNDRHYQLGHYEIPPYTEDTMRSVYHLRELEVYRMMHLRDNINRDPIDIFLSHDWPSDVWHHGDTAGLLRVKPYFQDDMRTGKLGSPPLRRIMNALMPDFWFAAHLHVKFAAIVVHNDQQIGPSSASFTKPNPEEINIDDVDANSSEENAPATEESASLKTTRFLALDKVIPGRGYMQFLQIPASKNDYDDNNLHFDAEWMHIMHKTHQLLTTSGTRCYLPQTLMPTPFEEYAEVLQKLKKEYGDDLIIPHIDPVPMEVLQCSTNPFREGNEQTDKLLKALALEHIWTIPAVKESSASSLDNSASSALAPQLVVPTPAAPTLTIPSESSNVDPNEIDI